MKRIALVALLLSGCRHSAAVTTISVIGETVYRQPAPQRQPRPRADTPVRCALQPVFFAFDSDQLNPLTQAQLVAISRCAFSPLALTGHADERGTEEYNLLLSQRRADVVGRYLSILGAKVTSSVGYGETRPVALGHGERAWARNRRVELQR